MQAIILAAGMGKRLKDLTESNTKCMVQVNGVTLIERMLRQLEKHQLSRIVIVVGYEGQKLIDYISTLNIETSIVYVDNPIYDKTNNIYSLSLAKDYLCMEDTLLFESDLIFDDSIIEDMINDPRETLALVDKYESWMDGTCVKLREDDTIEAFVPGKKFTFNEVEDYYKTVNIYKFSKFFSENHYVPFLEAYMKALGVNEYYEQVLRVICMLDEPVIKAKRLTGQIWYEIDDIQDLDIATSLFAPDENEKLELIKERHGGYWRYPKLLDFSCYANPYFPPKKLKDEMKASFDKLLTQYPSGMRVNALLAAKNFDVHQENILVGNGATELVKVLVDHFSGKTGYVRSAFKEIIDSYNEENSVFYIPQNENYSYTASDLMDYFADKDIQNLVVVNPNNHSGNYIQKTEMIKLISWANDKNISLVIDESFADFADEEDNTLISQSILDANRHLFVIKSISNSYGVPGLRMGVVASGDVNIISELKENTAIWNLNSFAEFYMQIVEKYKKDYSAAMELFSAERSWFQDNLKLIQGIRVIPSQANFILLELVNGVTSKELTQLLLLKYSISVRDFYDEISGRQYIRISVRNTEDNSKLLSALKTELDILHRRNNND